MAKKKFQIESEGVLHTVVYRRGLFRSVTVTVDSTKFKLGRKGKKFNEAFLLADESAMLCVDGKNVSICRLGSEYF